MDRYEAAEFQITVVLDGAKSQVSETEDGDLIIEGYAADYKTDRDEELFEPGAFDEGLKAYLDTNPVLLYHHKKAISLGQVIQAKLDQKGMWIKARVDKPEPGTFIADLHRKISRGTLRGFSVAGKFYRRFTPAGPRIYKADINEISVTPQPVNPRTLFAVGQKAFDDEGAIDTTLAFDGTEVEDEKALNEVADRIDALLERTAAARGTTAGKVSE